MPAEAQVQEAPPRRGRRSKNAILDTAGGMLEFARKLEDAGRAARGVPLAADVYSEAVAILRDGAERITRPLTD